MAVTSLPSDDGTGVTFQYPSPGRIVLYGLRKRMSGEIAVAPAIVVSVCPLRSLVGELLYSRRVELLYVPSDVLATEKDWMVGRFPSSESGDWMRAVADFSPTRGVNFWSWPERV